MVPNRLNASRDLVSVRDNTSDEAGFGLVEDTHQVIQLALEVGGHRLASLALLTFCVLINLQDLALDRDRFCDIGPQVAVRGGL